MQKSVSPSRKNEKQVYSLKYAEFVVPLVKSVQEQQAIIEEKEERIKTMEAENREFRNRLADVRQQLSQIHSKLDAQEQSLDECCEAKENPRGFENLAGLPGAYLGQNIPNPFENSTVIPYFISEETEGMAFIRVFDLNGKQIQEFKLATKGMSQVEFVTGNLPAGIYSYSLFVNDEKVDSKQMVIGN